MKELKNKVAVITGAASGIGRSLAERAGREGMKIVLAGINEKNLAQAEKELRAAGATTLCVQTDVSSKKDVERLARRTLDAFGAAHLLFNNAGVGGGRISETTLEDWQWIIGVNLWGVIHGVQTFLPVMLAQDDECHIVNIASVAGLVPNPDIGSYCVTKYGVVGLSEALYQELGQRGAKVRVSVVCPSYVRTRILDSVRNRPGRRGVNPSASLSKKEMDERWDALGVKTNSTVISVDQVTECVFNAIRDEHLYVLSHPESKDWVRTRMEDILDERNPAIMQP